jgi:putative metallohydrolase (TIGR04338 family)
MARDFQRGRVYDAEIAFRRECAGKSLNGHRSPGLLPEMRFQTLDEVQVYVDNVLSVPYTRKWSRRRCVVESTKGKRYAFFRDGELQGHIHLPANPKGWAMRELIVLHEVGHHCSRSTKYADHGPEFCQRYLKLIEMNMGPEAAERLAWHYDHWKVKY